MTLIYRLFGLPGSLEELRETQKRTGEDVSVNVSTVGRGFYKKTYPVEACINIRGTPLVSRIKIDEWDQKQDPLELVCRHAEDLERQGLMVGLRAINLYKD